jgi:hypothetical protein
MKKIKRYKSVIVKTILMLSLNVLMIGNGFSQVCFETHVDYLTGTNTNQSISVDFNNDGKLDLIVPSQLDRTISVFLGNGDGTFISPITSFTITPAFAGPTKLAAIQLNADGFLDLIFITSDYEIYKILNNGAGGFSGTDQYIGANARNLTTADINADGISDLITCNQTANVSVYLGIGAGNFGTNTNFNVGTTPYDVKAVDVNGDNKLDVVACNYGSNNISVLIGNGTGGFAPRVNYPTLTANPGGLVSVDLDLDGDNDIVVSNWNSTNIAVLKNNGSGVFGIATTFNTPSYNFGITTADFNLDGFPDIAVSSEYINVATILEGDGAGGFGWPIGYETDISPRFICSGDFNGDGRVDLATSNNASSTLSVLLNKIGITVHASATDTIVCYGDSIKLVGIGATTYTWLSGPIANGVNFLAPYGTTTYTVKGITTGCISMDTITISCKESPWVFLQQDTMLICNGDVIALNTCCNADSYTFDHGVVSGAFFSPTTDLMYHLTGTKLNGCSSTDSVFIKVNIKPTPVITTSTPICQGSTATLYATNSIGGNSYQWTEAIANVPAGSTPNSSSTQITQNGWYELVVTDTITNCYNVDFLTVNFAPLPIVSSNIASSVICNGLNITLTGAGANTYSWTGGVTNGVAFDLLAPQTYTVTGTNTVGCSNTSIITVNMPNPIVPQICTVDIDNLGNNNIIYWDKTNYPSADTFFVYRDIALNNYQVVAKIPQSTLSAFEDTVRTKYFPNTGDPKFSSFRYKLQFKDTCGNMSPMSLYHSTMFLQDQLNSNFSWSHYEIEGQPTPVPSLVNYLFVRDNNLDGIFETVIGSTTSNVFTDSQYFTYQSTADWRVETNWNISCNPSLRLNGTNERQTSIIKSKSNIKNNRLISVGINPDSKMITSQIKVYPNPATDILNVEFSQLNIDEAIISIENTLGQNVYTTTTNKSMNTINTSTMQTGVYFVKVKTGAKTSSQLFIKQ